MWIETRRDENEKEIVEDSPGRDAGCGLKQCYFRLPRSVLMIHPAEMPGVD